MTRGAWQKPPRPGMAPADRAKAGRPEGHRLAPWAAAVAVVGLLVCGRSLAARELPEGIITEIRIEGNKSIPTEKIKAKLLSKEGRPLDPANIDADIKTLGATKWFQPLSVKVYYEKDPKRDGYILIFHVTEMPLLTHVEFRGRSKVSLKDIEEATDLKIGSRADFIKNQNAVRQIKMLYEEKGYEMADIRLIEGGKPGDTRVIISIFEGPKSQVAGVEFIGNTYASDAMLRTKIKSHRRLFGLLRGKFLRENLEEDARELMKYYDSQGFFEVQVRPYTKPGPNLGDYVITFVISEGVQYKVRNISFEGNKRFTDAQLREGLVLHSNKPYNEGMSEADRKRLESKYFERGCIFTRVESSRRITNVPGVIDLIYKIEESNEYLLGELIIEGNERTMDRVIRREANMAALLPGEPLDKNRIEIFRNRLNSLRYFHAAPSEMSKKGLVIKIVNPRPAGQPYSGGKPIPTLEETLTRMQDPGPGPAAPAAPAPGAGQPLPPPIPDEPLAPGAGPAEVVPYQFGSNGIFNPPPDTPPSSLPPIAVPSPPPAPGGGAAPPPNNRLPSPPIGAGEPPGTFPSLPGGNMTDVGPDRQEPFPNRSYADIITQVDEAPTGRFMMGVGASSFGGLSGYVMIQETNFDILNPPRSLTEIFNGQAFRGRGQEFRLEFSPGTQINRALVSFHDPYVFDLPIGFGATGYIFQRFYPNWSEQRGGGRFSLGRQFGTMTYADVAFRVEDVSFYGYRTPAPAAYLAASGHTQLSSIRPSLRFDNRNNPYSPTKGQYLELAFEQGWGSFTFPKFTAEGRTTWTTGSRPDGTGKRTFTIRGFYGITGRDTPVYERFFAGDFRSMRGFAYRGVGPHVLGVNVGGIMTAIGSVEYQWPWTANDQLGQVVFCDFGTVESSYEFTNIRAAVGTGLRINIPQFGPLPLAFDFAVPIVKAPGDRTKYFTFFIGAFW
jgi:outer membrane protein insertion porin family